MGLMMAAMEYRTATAADAGAIANLHAESWRIAYRGMLSDAYLERDVVTDRLEIWTGRLQSPTDTHFTLLADDGGEVVGFAHTIADHDAEWGALLDNLHAAPARKGQGIGTRLMAESAAWVEANATRPSLYLWVLEDNKNARHFYDSLGAEHVGTEVRTGPGGSEATALRCAWPDLHVLTQLRPRG
jgi:ribosomal protein S18 acetylase RimI-like enzyme